MIDRRNVSLNLNVRGLRHSPTLDIQQRVRRLHAEGRQVFNFGLGQSPFPVPEIVVEHLRLHAAHKEYLPVEGLPALRQAVADYHQRKTGLAIDAGQVLVGPGSKELLFLLQLCFYGEILVPTPSWVSYRPQAEIIGRHVTLIPTLRREGWKISPEELAHALERQEDRYRPRLFVLNYPGNPTGVSYSDSELRALAEVLRDYEALVLSDEIYGGLHFTGQHASIARHYPEGTIVLDGISKWCGAGGWRLGVFTFPHELEWLKETMAAVASETYTTVSAPIQYAAVKAFEGDPEIEDYLQHARRILSALGNHCWHGLRSVGVGVARPHGAFYLFPDFRPIASTLRRRSIRTGDALCEALVDQTGVAVLPGHAFNRPRDELTARMAYVDFDGEAALAASREVGLGSRLPDEFLADHCPRVVAGMERLGNWIVG